MFKNVTTSEAPTIKKREQKAENKKTFGGEMGKPGSKFEMEGIEFVVLDRKIGKNRAVKCSKCSVETDRTHAKRHVAKHV